MSHSPAPVMPVPLRLLRKLRTWISAWSEMPPAPEEAPAEGSGASRHSYGAVRILVADDNPMNLMVISAMLESRGIVPVLAADGAEAVALAREQHFDLVLMDLQMPILDGLDATSAIRRFEAGLALPAVPVVAYSGTLPRGGGLEKHGMSGVLNKPCAEQELDDCLVRWCPSYRAAPKLQGSAQAGKGWQIAHGNLG